MAEIDERYKRGKIYTIRCRYDDSLIYVGSTIDTLAKRMGNHRRMCLKCKISLYNVVENDWDNWYIELYENFPCNNKQELLKREGQVIREIATINKCIAGRTPKEYKQDNQEQIKTQRKQYYENNKEILNEISRNYYYDNKQKMQENNKKWKEDNKEHTKESFKEYYQNNREKILEKKLEKVKCNICGCDVRKEYLVRHQKTKKCINYNLDNN